MSNMTFLLHVGLRCSFRKVCNVREKLLTNQVRHVPRWVSRRPVRVFLPEDGSKDELNFSGKLKTERENILSNKNQHSNDYNSPTTYENDERTQRFSYSKPAPRTEYDRRKYTYESERRIGEREKFSDNESGDKTLQSISNKKPQQKTKKERKKEEKQEKKQNKLKESAAKAGVPLYTKLPEDSTKLSTVMMAAKSKNKKKRSHIVLEGKRLINDAIMAGFNPEMIFFSRVREAADINIPDGIEVYKLPYKTIQLWSDLTTSPGILGILKLPSLAVKPAVDALPLTIICDNVRDPGNLGAILRDAAGVGCQKVVITKGCVDLWDPKVLRSGAGSHFRTNIVFDVEWNDLEQHVDSDASVFLADNSISYSEDSISDSSEEEDDELLEPSSEVAKDHCDKSETLQNRYENCIPVIPYFAADYVNQGPMVLVIGGETEGLSSNSYRLVYEANGVRLNIPLSNNVESLNSGTALGIIVFEMKRQFLTKHCNKHDEDICEKNEKIHLPGV